MRALIAIGFLGVLAASLARGQDLDALRQQLKDPDAKVRRRAAEALGKDKEAVPALMAALKDQDIDVRIHAATALRQIGADAKPALPALFEAAKDTANLGPVLRKSLRSSVCEAAIEAALKIDPACAAELARAALPDLTKALESKDSGVLQAAGYALAMLGPQAKPALPAIRQALMRAEGFASDALQRAVKAIDGEAGVAELIKDPKVSLQQRLEAIGSLGYDRKKSNEMTVNLLTGLLKDPEPQTRAAAVEALGRIDPPVKSALPALLGLLDDRELEVAYAQKRKGGRDLLPDTLARLGGDAVPGLVAVLKDEARPVFARYQAARTLSKLGRRAKAALPDLEAVAKDKLAVIALQSACGYVLAGGKCDNVLPLLQRGMTHPAPAVVQMTVEIIGRLGPAARKTLPDLTGLLHHEHPEVRIAAALAIGRLGGEARAAVPAIAAMLKSANARERYQAAQALLPFGPDAQAALPILIEQLNRLEPVSPNPILTTIGNMGPAAKSAVPALLDLLKKGGDEFLGKDVAETLGRIGPEAKAAVPELTTWLAKPSSWTRSAAVRALGQIGPEAKAAIPELEKLKMDESQEVRVCTAFALARISGDAKSQVAVLIKLWKEDDDLAQFHLAEAFVLLGREASPARDQLLYAFLNENTAPGTRTRVARALGQLTADADAIVPKALELIERPGNSYDRVTNCTLAAEVLGMLGPRAKAAVPALRRLLDNEENEVVEAAFLALEKIEGRP